MGTMTEDEVMDATHLIIEKWFFDESTILEECFNKEKQMDEFYGEGKYACPYLMTMIHMANINIEKGWNKREIMEMMDEILPDVDENLQGLQ